MPNPLAATDPTSPVASAPAALPDTARCLTCGYSLRGLVENRCPECGRSFDPLDHSTFGSSTWPGKLLRDCARPPSVWENVLAVVFTLVFVEGISRPGGIHGRLDVIVRWLALMLVLLAACGIRILIGRHVRNADVASGSTPRDSRRGRRASWLVIPICAAISLLAATPNWPLWLRFQISRPFLARAAAEFSVPGMLREPGGIIGLYYVTRIYRSNNGIIRFETGYQSSPIGFAYYSARPNDRLDSRLAPGWRIRDW